jgi:integrase
MILSQSQIGGGVPSSKVRLGEYLDAWLESVKVSVRSTTFVTYSYAVRRHIVPDLGDVPLLRLTAEAIEVWVSRLQSTGLSGSTVHQAFRVLKTALRQAVARGMIARSPLALVRSPRVPRRELSAWDEEQVRLFLAEARRSSRYYVLYLTAILTGMRRGELLALRWHDIDWTFGRASVTRTLVRADKQVEMREPKSQRSRRTVSLPPVLLEEFRRIRETQTARRGMLGDVYENHALIFCQTNGRPLHAHNVSQRDFKRVIRKAMVPMLRFHDLRHVCATLMLRQGIHPKVVGEQLGHASVGVTLDVYSHVLPGMHEEAVRSLAGRLVEDTR